MKKIYLIDCPGVVYNPSESDEEKVLKGVVRVELVGMISHKKRSLITIFGHKHKIKNFIRYFS